MLLTLSLVFHFISIFHFTTSNAEFQGDPGTKWTVDMNNSVLLSGLEGMYTFGFIRACSSSHDQSPRFYLSIWDSYQDIQCPHSKSSGISWQANRDVPVSANATLTFQTDGNLVLADGLVEVWSSNTSDRGVLYMELLAFGNLVLFASDRETVWESFDHPTDNLLENQYFKVGDRLVSAVSSTDMSQGSFYFELLSHALVGYARAPIAPQTFMKWEFVQPVSYLMVKGCFLFAYNKLDKVVDYMDVNFTYCPQDTHLKLHHDGGLRLWSTDGNRSSNSLGTYVSACGKYSILRQKDCSCLDFDPSLKLQPIVQGENSFGCSFPTETDHPCNASQVIGHHLVEARGYDYAPLVFMQGSSNLSSAACKKLCLANCSCVAAFFHEFQNRETTCYHVTTLYTVSIEPLRSGYFSSMFLKLKQVPGAAEIVPLPSSSRKALKIVSRIAIASFVVISVGGLLIALVISRWRRRMARIAALDDESCTDA